MSLNHSPHKIVKELLISLNLGTDPTDNGAWPVFVGAEPDKPDNCITVYSTTGITQGKIQNTGEVIDFPGIQIRIRGKFQDVADTKARAIKDAIDPVKKRNLTIDSSTYIVWSLSRTSDVIHIGRDPETNRELFTINALVSLSIRS